MEKEKDRVLAYTLATLVEHDALDDVSGGAGALPTFVVTGIPASPDVAFDH